MLMRQGDPGEELFLLLDGILRVEVDGKAVADLGPGAVLGERPAGGRPAHVDADGGHPGQGGRRPGGSDGPGGARGAVRGHRREEDTN